VGTGVLALVDSVSGEHRWLDAGSETFISGVGLAVAGETLYCACSDAEGRSFLAVFDLAGDRRDLVPLARVADIHSIFVLDGDLIAVSTGTDEVVRLALRDGAPFETLWACSAEGADTQHLNAVTVCDGSMLVSDDRADAIYRITYSP